jgi:hypothetical protein
MKNLTTLILLLMSQYGFTQSQQLTAQVSSGLFSFGGKSANNASFMNISDVGSNSSYTNNPYGRKSDFSYGVGLQFQRLTTKKFIYGIQLSYESLSSKLEIDNAYGEITWTVKEGKTVLINKFFNVFPFIGQRVKLVEGIDSDFLLGFDFGIGLSSMEKYSLTTNQGQEISGTHERDLPKVDFRPRIEFVNYYKDFGFSVGYSYGVINYRGDLDGGNRQVNARYLRFGLNYRMRI